MFASMSYVAQYHSKDNVEKNSSQVYYACQ